MIVAIRAFAWQILAKHRVFFTSTFILQLLIAAVVGSWPSERMEISFAVLLTLPVMTQMIYLLAIFSFGAECDLLDSTAPYPKHMLQLPLSSTHLVLVPFLLGSALILGLWFAFHFSITIPLNGFVSRKDFGMHATITPLVFITLLAALQATLWCNYRYAILRGISISCVLLLPICLVAGLFGQDLGDRLVISVLLSGTAVAVLLAIANLRLARTGEESGVVGNAFGFPVFQLLKHVRVGERAFERSNVLLQIRNWRQRIVFANAMTAQTWYEFRRYCVPVVIIVAGFLTFLVVICCVWPDVRAPRDVMLYVPLFVASISSMGIGSINQNRDTSELAPFFACRPFTCTEFVYAKWMACIVCSLSICIVSIATFLTSNYLCGDFGHLTESWASACKAYSRGQVLFGAVLCLVAYVATIWMCLIQFLPIILTGRSWLQTFLVAVAITFALSIIYGVSLRYEGLLPWTIAGFFLLKLTLAFVGVRKITQKEFVETGLLFQMLLLWTLGGAVFAVGIYGFVAEQGGIASLFILLSAIFLVMPLSRLAFAPLALHFNRHR